VPAVRVTRAAQQWSLKVHARVTCANRGRTAASRRLYSKIQATYERREGCSVRQQFITTHVIRPHCGRREVWHAAIRRGRYGREDGEMNTGWWQAKNMSTDNMARGQ